jgi:hypothetical protein
MRSLINDVATSPRLYAAWAVLVLLALSLSYLADPYVFALATLALAAISAVISLIGLSVALRYKGMHRSGRGWIIVSLAVTAAAVVAALWLVRGFQWA